MTVNMWTRHCKIRLDFGGKPVTIRSSCTSSTELKTPSLREFPTFLKDIESKWKLKLERRFERERFYADKDEQQIIKPRYVLSMFPYPSGRLHLGHVRIYTSGDILSRFSKLMIKNSKTYANYEHVINPMGFDSFGLPAENAARERGLDPAKWTNSNIRIMKKQMDDLGFQFDWREATSNPTYYKWTQDLFLKLKDANLVYKSYARVNWDPVDKTVLADEQVDEEGRSWRSGAIVEKRNFKQWFVKVNAFTNALYQADNVEKVNWRDILMIQRNWIGEPSGWLFYLNLKLKHHEEILLVFTKQPELFTHPKSRLLISRDHWLEQMFSISSVGHVQNPFNDSPLRVELTDDTEALPKNCQATLINEDVSGSYIDPFNRQRTLLQAKLTGLGGYYTSDKYRDWLVSRQRYWGTPIPVVDCKNCGLVGVARSELPVTLPQVASHSVDSHHQTQSDAIVSPIEKLSDASWLHVDCPSCGHTAKRECDTLDTLFDSSWYFLRYSSNPLPDKPFDDDFVQPVWTYIGGKEHASMHLFYARFVTHFLEAQGELKFKEPFAKLLMQGVVKSKTYKLPDGRYVAPTDLDQIEDKSKLSIDYEKMSKSKGNGVDPQDLLEAYGIDATRMCLVSYANPTSERLWRSNQEEFRDVLTFMKRVCLTVDQYVQAGAPADPKLKPSIQDLSPEHLDEHITDLTQQSDKSLLDGLFFIQVSNEFRQFISCLHVMLSALRSRINTSAIYTKEFAEVLGSLIVMMSPMTPHFSEELWSHYSKSRINPLRAQGRFNFDLNLQASDQPWPLPDPDYPRPIKIRIRGLDDSVETIRMSGESFRNATNLEIADIVKSHYKAVGTDDCDVTQVTRYLDLSALVDITSPSLKAKIARAKKSKKKLKTNSGTNA